MGVTISRTQFIDTTTPHHQVSSSETRAIKKNNDHNRQSGRADEEFGRVLAPIDTTTLPPVSLRAHELRNISSSDSFSREPPSFRDITHKQTRSHEDLAMLRIKIHSTIENHEVHLIEQTKEYLQGATSSPSRDSLLGNQLGSFYRNKSAGVLPSLNNTSSPKTPLYSKKSFDLSPSGISLLSINDNDENQDPDLGSSLKPLSPRNLFRELVEEKVTPSMSRGDKNHCSFEDIASNTNSLSSPSYLDRHPGHIRSFSVTGAASPSPKKYFSGALALEQEDTLINLRRNSSPGSVMVNLPWCRTRTESKRSPSHLAPIGHSPSNSPKQFFFEGRTDRRARSKSLHSISSSMILEPEALGVTTPTRHGFSETKTLETGIDQEGRKTINQYSIIKFLGKGNYGKVKLCRNVITNELVAMKIINKSLIKDKRSAVKQEIAILKALDHPNIVTLNEVIEDPSKEKLYMVFEYVDGGELLEVKMDGSVEAEPMAEETARSYFQQLLNGIEYLHNNQVIHRDIKPSNILISQSGCLKISDFGVSKLCSGNDDTFSESFGTPAFLPPEACGVGEVSGRAADVWACGVTLYAMIFGSVPFKGDGVGPGKLFSLYQAIQYSPVQLPFDVSSDLKSLFRSIFAKDPSQRITIAELQNHQWVLCKGDNELKRSREQANQNTVCVSEADVNNAITLVDKFVIIAKLKNKMAAKRRGLKSTHTLPFPSSPLSSQSPKPEKEEPQSPSTSSPKTPIRDTKLPAIVLSPVGDSPQSLFTRRNGDSGYEKSNRLKPFGL